MEWNDLMVVYGPPGRSLQHMENDLEEVRTREWAKYQVGPQTGD